MVATAGGARVEGEGRMALLGRLRGMILSSDGTNISSRPFTCWFEFPTQLEGPFLWRCSKGDMCCSRSSQGLILGSTKQMFQKRKGGRCKRSFTPRSSSISITSKTRQSWFGNSEGCGGIMTFGHLTVFGCFYINLQLLESGSSAMLFD